VHDQRCCGYVIQVEELFEGPDEPPTPMITEAQMRQILELMEKAGVDMPKVNKKYGGRPLAQLTAEEGNSLLKGLDEMAMKRVKP